MGLRFRKILKVIPGVRINLAKKGASLSVGGKGLTYNIGRRGTRSTVGLPGSGVSWSTYKRSSGGIGSILWIAAIGLLVLAIYLLR